MPASVPGQRSRPSQTPSPSASIEHPYASTVQPLGAALLLAACAVPGRAGDVPAARPTAGLAHPSGAHEHWGHDGPADDPDSGEALLDTPAPEWTFTRWIGPPLSLAGLRGKVVLLR